MSLAGSAPTTVNGAVRPSEKVTVVAGLAPSVSMLPGMETTWLLVRISPSEVRMIPEPSSFARPRSVSSFTTLGTTFAATCSVDPTGALAAGWVGAAAPIALVTVVDPAMPPDGAEIRATVPPIPAESTESATAPTTSAPVRPRRPPPWRWVPGRTGGAGGSCTPGRAARFGS